MHGFSAILDIDEVEDLPMMKDKLICMSEKTLKLDNIEVSKKKFISPNNQLISIQQTQKKQLDLTDLSLVMMVLSILLATKKIT